MESTALTTVTYHPSWHTASTRRETSAIKPKPFQTSIPTLKEEIIGNIKDISSEYITFLIPYFLWIYHKLYIFSLLCFFPIIYVKPLINTGTKIDLIRRNIIEKLGLKLGKIKAPQLVVECFGKEASEKL